MQSLTKFHREEVKVAHDLTQFGRNLSLELHSYCSITPTRLYTSMFIFYSRDCIVTKILCDLFPTNHVLGNESRLVVY